MRHSESEALHRRALAVSMKSADTGTSERCLSDDYWCDGMPELVESVADQGLELDLNAVLAQIPEVDRSDVVIDAAIRSIFAASQGRNRHGGTTRDAVFHTLVDRSPHLASKVRLAAILDGLEAEHMGSPQASIESRFDHLPREFGPVWCCNEQRYLLVERLRGGRRSHAFRAIDRARSDGARSHMVVVKVLPEEDQISSNWAIGEASRLARVDCPNVCRVVDAGIADGIPYLVTDFVAGSALIHLPSMGVFPLPAQRAVALILDVARGLGQAHSAGVRHLDIHPGNIVLSVAGGAVLVDFGLGVHAFEPDEQANTSHACGALGFIAPELANTIQGDPIDLARADVYSLGGVLLWLLTGEAPNGATMAEAEAFVAEAETSGPSTLRAAPGLAGINLDDDLRKIIARSLAINPLERYESVAGFASDLRAWIGHEAISWTNPSSLHRFRLAIRRASPARRWGVASAATFFLVLLSLLIVQTLNSMARERDAAISRAAASDSARAAAETRSQSQEIAEHQVQQTGDFGGLLRMMLRDANSMKGVKWIPALVALRDMSTRLGEDRELIEQIACRRLALFEQAERLLPPDGNPDPSIEDAAFAAARGSWILESGVKDAPARAVQSLERANEIVQKLLPPNERFRRAVEYRHSVAKVIESKGRDTAAVAACQRSQDGFDSLPEIIQKRLSDAMADKVESGARK